VKIIEPEFELSKVEEHPFIDLINIILAKKEKVEDTSKEEREIDMMVYKLYGLSFDEVRIVEPEFALSREEYEK
jgi:adenine-specific DNA-methyltransferase